MHPAPACAPPNTLRTGKVNGCKPAETQHLFDADLEPDASFPTPLMESNVSLVTQSVKHWPTASG